MKELDGLIDHVERLIALDQRANPLRSHRLHEPAIKHQKRDERRKMKDERRKTKDERRKTKDERRKTKDERRKTKDERRKTKDER